MTREEIRELRDKLGLTQEGLALKLGVRTDTVSSWESGRRKPDRAAVRLLELAKEGKI